MGYGYEIDTPLGWIEPLDASFICNDKNPVGQRPLLFEKAEALYTTCLQKGGMGVYILGSFGSDVGRGLRGPLNDDYRAEEGGGYLPFILLHALITAHDRR